MPPPWFDRLTAGLISAVLGFGLVGLVAAEFGLFVVSVVLFIGGATAYTIHLVGFSSDARSSGAGRRLAALVVLVAAAAVVGNGVFHAEQLVGGAEPAAINGDARELAREGDLDDEAVAPFVGDTVRAGPTGLFTAIAGAIGWFGRDAMLWAGPLTAGVALLALYGLATRLVRPWVAAAVTVAVALNPAFVYLARDATPEPLVMALVLSGLAALIDAREEGDPRPAAVGGVLLGAAALARFEWILLAPALVIYLGLELRRAELVAGWLDRRRHARYVAAIGFGFAVPAGLAVWLTREGGRLFAADGPGPGWAVLAAAAVGLGLWLARQRPGRITRPAIRPGYVAIAVVAAGLALVISRPLFLEDTGDRSVAVEAAQAAEEVRVDGTRTYAEDAALWLGWYLGPVGAAAGLLGAGLVTDAAARGRARRWTPLLVLGGVTTLVWLLRPGLEPLHPTVMQRFLPLAIPGLLLAAGWLIDRLWTRQRLQEVAQVAALVLAAGLVAIPAWYLSDAPEAATQVGVRDGLAALCAGLGADPAVVIVDRDGSGAVASLARPLRGFCEIPTTVLASPTAAEARELAAVWADAGRNLVVMSDDVTPFVGEAAPAAVVLAVEWESLQATVSGRPRAVVASRLEVWITRLGPGP